jgi:hypothetical protein
MLCKKVARGIECILLKQIFLFKSVNSTCNAGGEDILSCCRSILTIPTEYLCSTLFPDVREFSVLPTSGKWFYAKSTEKFDRWRKNFAANIIFSYVLFYKHSCLKLVAKKVEFTCGLTSVFLQIIKALMWRTPSKKVRPLFCHFLKNLQKIQPLFLPAVEIFMGPLLCFASEISASWQHWLNSSFLVKMCFSSYFHLNFNLRLNTLILSSFFLHFPAFIFWSFF